MGDGQGAGGIFGAAGALSLVEGVMRQIGTFKQESEPEAEPITLDQAKAHCRAEFAGVAEDALFERLIKAARLYVENDCGLALMAQDWTATFDAWDDKGLRLRPHPVTDLVEVAVWDGTAFVAQTLSGFQFIAARPALVLPAEGMAPLQPLRTRQGIRITFTAGFASAEDVPADIVTAMLQLIAHWHENREPTALRENLSVVADIKFTVRDLLTPWRSVRVG